MGILEYEFDGQGLLRVYENCEWMVGIKNWKPANDLEGIDCVERHTETDELFVLLSGECILLFANEAGQADMRSNADLAQSFESQSFHDQNAFPQDPIASKRPGNLEICGVPMQRGKVYNIPKGLWHNTVTKPDTKLILIEAANTGSHNSDVLKLTAEQIAAMKNLVDSIRQKA